MTQPSDFVNYVKLAPDPEPTVNVHPGTYRVEYMRAGGIRHAEFPGVAQCMGAETGLVLKDKPGNVLAFFPWEVEPVAIRLDPEDAVPGR